ncbi:RebB family R body protein [Agarilytica rhodophyticola]|uniref:RebB family R body protein n=1 Tax=Agarilytica rhodophyticola TaxID=1737490 RepID=UPI001C1F90CD|nr:RebB family R body protein [Agarilytica rhodophyticola]
MNETESKGTESESTPEEINPFSSQATGLVETTFAETLGLAMHNAVTNQQNSQMTASASITNACARLLQSPTPKKPKPKSKALNDNESSKEIDSEDGKDDKNALSKKPKSWLNVKNFMKRKPKDETPAPDESDDDHLESKQQSTAPKNEE